MEQSATETTLSKLEASVGERDFRVLAEALPQIVWTSDPDGVLDYISPQWEKFSGIPQDDAEFLEWGKCLHPDDLEETLRIWQAALDSGDVYERIFRLRRADGCYRWFAARAIPYRDESGIVVKWYGTSTDIHEQKILQEDHRQRAQDQDRFIAMLGHELRNPLSAIMTSYDILEREDLSLEQHETAFSLLGQQLCHLNRLVDDTLDISRLKSGKLRLICCPLELTQVARDCCHALSDEAEAKGVTLTAPPHSFPEAWISGDDVRMAQCLSNLLTNALKFTDPGGQVTVEVVPQGETIEVRVADTGIGMDLDEAHQLFAPFVQGKEAHRLSTEGLGLGLAVVQELITLHKGTILVESPGRGLGATFTIRVPAIDAPEPSEPIVAEAKEEEPHNCEIFLIEDNPSVSKSLSLLLELEGHHVTHAIDGEQALSYLEEMTPEIIISDLTLPGHLKGWDLAEKITSSYPEDKRPYLIALSGHTQPHHIERSHEAGFDEHLAKPPSAAQLRDAIRRGWQFHR